ncbi:hypothetical protein [Marinomonas shanghaiensis]
MDMITTDISLLRLLQLSSVGLPVGGLPFHKVWNIAIDQRLGEK